MKYRNNINGKWSEQYLLNKDKIKLKDIKLQLDEIDNKIKKLEQDKYCKHIELIEKMKFNIERLKKIKNVD